MANNKTGLNNLSLRDVFLSSRPFWWITTAVPFMFGYWINNPSFGVPFMVGAWYFLVPYNLFLYGINDIFDYESDIRNPRKAGIEGAVLAKQKHWPLFAVILAANMPFLVYFAIIGAAPAVAWLGLTVFMTLAYSVKYVRFKEIPVLDSITSSFHYTSPFIFGALLAGGQNLLLPAFAAFYIWGMGNHAFGAIQDVIPDRQAGIQSIATKLGAARVILFCAVLYAVAAMLPVIAYGFLGVVPSILLSLYVALAVRTWPYRHNPNNPIFRSSWRFLTYCNYGIGAVMSMYFIFLLAA